jgi:predicted nucleic acid-binding Zn ribbon protein
MRKASKRTFTLIATLCMVIAMNIFASAALPEYDSEMWFMAAREGSMNGGKNYITILSPKDGETYSRGQVIPYRVRSKGTWEDCATRPYITFELEGTTNHVYNFTYPADLAFGKSAVFNGSIQTDNCAPGTYLFGVMNAPYKDGQRLSNTGRKLPLVAIEITISDYAIGKAPKAVKAKAGKKGVTVSWANLKKTKKNAKLYKKIKAVEVQYSTDSRFPINDAVSTRVKKKKNSVNLKLKGKTTYYVRVRYVGKDGNSAWSAVKKVTTR